MRTDRPRGRGHRNRRSGYAFRGGGGEWRYGHGGGRRGGRGGGLIVYFFYIVLCCLCNNIRGGEKRKKEKKRQLQDSNLRGQCPVDFESTSLTTRTNCHAELVSNHLFNSPRGTG